MKRIFVGIFLVLSIFLGVNSIFTPVYSYPSNAIVKVGIMDEKYTTTEKSEVTVYGTEQINVINPKTKEEILSLEGGKFLTVVRENGEYIVSYIDTETGAVVEINVKDDFTIICPSGVIGIKDFIRGGKPAMYRGEFRFIACGHKSDKFYLVNALDVEYYLKGVVPCEMPVTFGLEALKSQAVAARVYSLTPRARMSRAYDVVDSVASQVYYGYNRESDIANKAIDETHGIVALYNDEMIIAVFSSTAGGYTECYSETFSDPVTQQFPSPEKPYLTAKPDLPNFKPLDNEEDAYKFYSTKPISYDIHSPLYRWTRKWTKEELQNILKNTLVVQSKTGFVIPKLENAKDFGELKDIRVTQRGVSGKIVFMEIETDNAIYTVGKELVIRRMFTKDGKALPSANVVFKKIGTRLKPNKSDSEEKDNSWDEIIAYGGGFGHGCGLSQYGAKYMAQDCKMSFETILKHYYNGICLGTKPVQLSNLPIPVCFYAPKKKAILVIPNRRNVKNITLKIGEENIDLDLSNYKYRVELDISEYVKAKQLNTIIFNPVTKDKNTSIKLYVRLL